MSWKQAVLELPSIVAVWADDADGSTWFDAGPEGLDLTAVGAIWNASGGVGEGLPGAWELDGVDDLLRRLGDDPELALGVDNGLFWVAFWAYYPPPTSQESWAQIIGKGDTSWQVRVTTNATLLQLDARGGTGGDELARSSPNVFSSGQWHFVVAQHEGGRLAIYLGGPDEAMGVIATANRSGTLDASPESSFTIGMQDNAGTLRRAWRGSVAGVAVGDGASLTTSQMDELRLATFDESGDGPPPTEYEGLAIGGIELVGMAVGDVELVGIATGDQILWEQTE